MKCPNCGKEMELGWLHAGKGLIWSPHPKKRTIFCGADEVRIGSFWSSKVSSAMICKHCQTILLHYDTNESL